jgi:hypothetical protein
MLFSTWGCGEQPFLWMGLPYDPPEFILRGMVVSVVKWEIAGLEIVGGWGCDAKSDGIFNFLEGE